LYFFVLIVFSLRRESLKLILEHFLTDISSLNDDGSTTPREATLRKILGFQDRYICWTWPYRVRWRSTNFCAAVGEEGEVDACDHW
jgi:hypothetical protein